MIESDGQPLRIELSDTQGHLRVDPESLRRDARAVLRAEGVGRALVSVAVVDDATIREVNRRHLDHDWETDVISFPLSEPEEPELAGELVVSAETARRVAEGRGVDPSDELTLYVVHGLLHLCGYDDLTDGDRARMRRREAELLGAIGRPGAVFEAPRGPGREAGSWTA